MAEPPVPGAAPPPVGVEAAHPHIDLQKLADKVYHLLVTDARVGRSRSDTPPIYQRPGEG